MSGGVDSSTVAALLLAEGRDVVGVTLRMRPGGSDDGAIEDARAVAAALGVDHHVVDVSERFAGCVLDTYRGGYAAGVTPNPCIACNPSVKFPALIEAADRLDCDTVATGHYARIVTDIDGAPRLARGSDRSKDQSYFLYRLGPDALSRIEFPLGDRAKDEVRALARGYGLEVADKPESQDTCFSGHIERGAGVPGEIVDASGRVLGAHSGIEAFTVGQRRGIGVTAPEPLYVQAIDVANHRVVVGTYAELARRTVRAEEAIWYVGVPESPVPVEVRIRSNMEPVLGVVSGDSYTLTVRFDEPVYGVAPGQSVVCYQSDTVFCGGIIT